MSNCPRCDTRFIFSGSQDGSAEWEYHEHMAVFHPDHEHDWVQVTPDIEGYWWIKPEHDLFICRVCSWTTNGNTVRSQA